MEWFPPIYNWFSGAHLVLTKGWVSRNGVLRGALWQAVEDGDDSRYFMRKATRYVPCCLKDKWNSAQICIYYIYAVYILLKGLQHYLSFIYDMCITYPCQSIVLSFYMKSGYIHILNSIYIYTYTSIPGTQMTLVVFGLWGSREKTHMSTFGWISMDPRSHHKLEALGLSPVSGWRKNFASGIRFSKNRNQLNAFMEAINTNLGGGFKHFVFSSLPGDMIQFD